MPWCDGLYIKKKDVREERKQKKRRVGGNQTKHITHKQYKSKPSSTYIHIKTVILPFLVHSAMKMAHAAV
jgi:hypothetical protein